MNAAPRLPEFEPYPTPPDPRDVEPDPDPARDDA
jgi:hypothetical protein